MEPIRRPGTRYIATVPAGATIVRLATPADLALEPRRLTLIRDPDGTTYWIGVDCYRECVSAPTLHGQPQSAN